MSYGGGWGCFIFDIMNMAGFGINISDVIAFYNDSGKSSEGTFFEIEYRKADGDFGHKKKVRRYAGKKHLTGVSGEKRDFRSVGDVERDASKLFLIEDGATHNFEVFICCLVSFNGKRIDHRF